jgi:hypothetical protein
MFPHYAKQEESTVKNDAVTTVTERKRNFNICRTIFGQAGPSMGRICRVQDIGIVIKTRLYHQETLYAIRSFYFRHGNTCETGNRGRFYIDLGNILRYHFALKCAS